jgi:hypothetical protein
VTFWRAQRGQAAIEYLGALAVVAAVIALVASLNLAAPLEAGLRREIEHIFVPGPIAAVGGRTRAGGDAGAPRAVAAVIPRGGGSTGPGDTVERVLYPRGKAPILEVSGRPPYQLLDNPQSGDDARELAKVRGLLQSDENDRMEYKFIARGSDAKRPDMVGYKSLEPGSELRFVEVKNVTVTARGVNSNTMATQIRTAAAQDADEVAVVLDPAPTNTQSVVEALQSAERGLVADGRVIQVTLVVPDEYGIFHAAWTDTLGPGTPGSDLTGLEQGEGAAKADYPEDPDAGFLDPGGPGDPGDPGDPGAPVGGE